MPDNSQTDEAIKNRIRSIFPDEQTKAKMIELLVARDKPQGYGAQSHAPYFTAYFGQQMQRMVDSQLAFFEKNEFQEIVYSYEEFCYPFKQRHEGGVSELSLYNRVNQSIRFLLEKMDPDKKYRKWRDMVDVKRDTEHRCIRIFIKREIRATIMGEEMPQPKMTEPVAIRPKWKRELDEWIENTDRSEPFVKENLILSPQEQEDLRAELNGLSHIEAAVDAGSVKAIKINI